MPSVLVADINRVHKKRPSYGYRRTHAELIRGAKGVLNHKRVRRVWRDYVNFFMPSMKLIEKVLDGARVTKRHDKAQSPYRRFLDLPVPQLVVFGLGPRFGLRGRLDGQAGRSL